MGALLPISDRAEREMEPRSELLLREVQLLAQGAHSRHATSACKLRRGRRRTAGVGERSPMALLLAHGIESTPVGLGRPLRIELKFRDTSFFHAALPPSGPILKFASRFGGRRSIRPRFWP